MNKEFENSEDLFDLLADEDDDETLVTAVFKGTKIINLESVKLTNERELQFIISHYDIITKEYMI